MVAPMRITENFGRGKAPSRCWWLMIPVESTWHVKRVSDTLTSLLDYRFKRRLWICWGSRYCRRNAWTGIG